MKPPQMKDCHHKHLNSSKLGGFIRAALPGLAIRLILAALVICTPTLATAQNPRTRTISGTIITQKRESVSGAVIVARYSSGENETTSDEHGRFSLVVPQLPVLLSINGNNIEPLDRLVNENDPSANLEIVISY